MLHTGLAEAVAAAFGLGGGARLEGPVATGRLGRVWRLTTDLGTFAVKDFAGPVDAGAVERDAGYQDRVRATGVPMPPVLRTGSGAALADVDGPVRAYGWAEVRATDRQLDPAAVGRDAWERLVTRLERARAPFAGQLAALVPELVEAAGVQTPPRCTRRCHRDLWADNVRAAPSGGLVVLDWENSGPADPAQELGVVLYEFGCGDRGRMRALVDAYEGAGGTARLAFPADLTMLVAQTHHIARTACERWLASRTEEERADNAAWALEFLDDPVTLRTVELLLDAVG